MWRFRNNSRGVGNVRRRDDGDRRVVGREEYGELGAVGSQRIKEADCNHQSCEEITSRKELSVGSQFKRFVTFYFTNFAAQLSNLFAERFGSLRYVGGGCCS